MIKELIRKPTNEDVQYIVDNIRAEDEIECLSLSGSTIREALDNTPDLLKNSQVWVVENKVVCIFGVNPCGDGTGVVWLLATNDFDKYNKLFAVKCLSVFKKVIKDYNYLVNYVYSKNTTSIKWLEWLGFKIYDAQPVGIKGANFHKFDMINV